MALTVSQRAIWEKARTLGAGEQGMSLGDGACAYLVARVAYDLGLTNRFPEFHDNVPELFSKVPPEQLVILTDVDPLTLYARLLDLEKDADTYFACIATLHKARLKYAKILKTQPLPTFEQVGPRGLLQWGAISSPALAALLLWRKWFFDIDNRAGQETGYLFEPIIAHSIGGTPAPAKRSPVKRHRDGAKRRQVDCIRGDRAYELKIRVTIAASGQGRWGEELDFPLDCRESHYVPVLIVLDSTDNPKLRDLQRAFLSAGGEVYIGSKAWEHLEDLAGPTMSKFLDRYVRFPLQELLKEAGKSLRPFSARMADDTIFLTIGSEELVIEREPSTVDSVDGDEIPEDAEEQIPG